MDSVTLDYNIIIVLFVKISIGKGYISNQYTDWNKNMLKFVLISSP